MLLLFIFLVYFNLSDIFFLIFKGSNFIFIVFGAALSGGEFEKLFS